MTKDKKNYNQLELSFKKFLEKYYKIKGYLNSTYGIDLILQNNIKIEIKTAFKYIKRSDNFHKSNYRFGNYSLKPYELVLDDIDYYVFIEKVNKISNMKFIKELTFKIIKANTLKNYLIIHNFELIKRINLSINTIKKIKSINLNRFIDNLY